MPTIHRDFCTAASIASGKVDPVIIVKYVSIDPVNVLKPSAPTSFGEVSLVSKSLKTMIVTHAKKAIVVKRKTKMLVRF